MKKNLFSTLLVSTLLVGATFFASCDEDSGIVVGIPQEQNVLFKFPPGAGTELSRVDTISANLDSILATQNATREDIESIIFSNMELTLTDVNGLINTNKNFNNLKSISIGVSEISSTFSELINVDSTAFATLYLNTNPINPPSVTADFDLLKYVVNPQFRVQLAAKLNQAVTDTVYISAKLKYEVKVKL